jgi:non-specific serine/threonine protein kinase
VRLNPQFFRELVTSPVPIDLRAFKALRGSPMAMDVYTWLTYRMSCTHRRTAPIRWEALMGQVGAQNMSNSEDDYTQAVRNFKKAFVSALERVRAVYPAARYEISDKGLTLIPSPTHVPMLAPKDDPQGALF